MELSYFLGQLFGLAIIIFSVAGLMRPSLMTSALKDFDHESFSTLAIGFIAVVAGLAILLSHNVWDGTWRVWITLFGVSSLMKGGMYMIAPHTLIRTSRKFFGSASSVRTLLVLALMLGIYLAYKGFGN